jgi:hypothetical protein
MNEFIEKNKRSLRFLCDALHSIGQVVLVLGMLGVFAIITLLLLSKFGYWRAPEGFKFFLKMLPLGAFNILFIGIGVLGLSQFIKYLVDKDYKPGWILRHGELFCYLYALLTVLSVVWVYTINPFDHSEHMNKGLPILIVVFSTTVRVLILVGLGQILRRILPMIEESKTLV